MPTKRPAAAISQEIATAKARLAELEVELFEATRVGELVVTKDGQLLVTLPVSEKGVAPKHEQPFSYRYSGGEVCISGDDPYDGTSNTGHNDFNRELVMGGKESVLIYGSKYTFLFRLAEEANNP